MTPMHNIRSGQGDTVSAYLLAERPPALQRAQQDLWE